ARGQAPPAATGRQSPSSASNVVAIETRFVARSLRDEAEEVGSWDGRHPREANFFAEGGEALGRTKELDDLELTPIAQLPQLQIRVLGRRWAYWRGIRLVDDTQLTSRAHG